jgi:hypothetical protein
MFTGTTNITTACTITGVELAGAAAVAAAVVAAIAVGFSAHRGRYPTQRATLPESGGITRVTNHGTGDHRVVATLRTVPNRQRPWRTAQTPRASQGKRARPAAFDCGNDHGAAVVQPEDASSCLVSRAAR